MVVKSKGMDSKMPETFRFRNWCCVIGPDFHHRTMDCSPTVFLSKETKQLQPPSWIRNQWVVWWWNSWRMNFPRDLVWFMIYLSITIGNSWSSWNVTRYFYLHIYYVPTNESWSPTFFGRWRLRSTQRVIRITPPDLMFHWGLWWRTTFFFFCYDNSKAVKNRDFTSWWFRNPAVTSWGKGSLSSLSTIIYDGL